MDHTEDQYGVLHGVSVGTGFLGTVRFDGNILSGPLGVASPPLSAPERYLDWSDEASRWLLDVVVGELAISLVSSAQVPMSNMSLSDEPDGYGMVIYDETAVPDVRVVSGQLNFNPSGPGVPARGDYDRLLAYLFVYGNNINVEMVRQGGDVRELLEIGGGCQPRW